MMEKRQKQRVKLKLPCYCVAFGYRQVSFHATIVNLGPNGFAFVGNAELTVNQEVEVRIHLEKEKLVLKAKVVNSSFYKITNEYTSRVKILSTSSVDEKKYMDFYLKQLSQTSLGGS